MAISNNERIRKALEAFKEGMVPFAEQRFKQAYGKQWVEDLADKIGSKLDINGSGEISWDSWALLKAIQITWNDAFRDSLGMSERAWVSEILDGRNKNAHEKVMSSDATYRLLDTIERILNSVSAHDYAQAVKVIRTDLQRSIYSEEARNKVRYAPKTEGQPQSGLKAWREVVTPHPDVSSGNYQKAEFAADLAEVHRGEASIEYQDPREFFRRTHLTQGLTDLLKNALKRLCQDSGDPVIELQTNFGGGKTHSMLALYHLFANGKAAELPGVEPLLQSVGVAKLPQVSRAVLVGTAVGAGQSRKKSDGIVVNTLWGELAWQLGNSIGRAQEAFDYVAESDKNGTSPGSEELADLFKAFSPSLILIDEWVAYIRQTYNTQGLPGGSFDANLTFAQALTEAAKAAPHTLLVASLPVSNIETGGEGGQRALASLKHTFNRVQSSWRPANSEESYEIIRRRLFEPLTGEQHAYRDAVVGAFVKLYKENTNEFPPECKEFAYKSKMESCYPIHPELFERLYSDWSTLEKFQQTRGVLRLMASVIHSLWEQGDKNLLIMPSSIPIEDRGVCDSLTYYLSDGWKGVIDKDIDGLNSLPLAIDQENPNLGRYSACRRVARTIFMGSAPIAQGSNPGIVDKKINLGCVQPGEAVAIFGDTAIRRLEERATYLYQESRRYWYSTQPSVDQLARERAQGIDHDAYMTEIIKQLKLEADNRKRGDFVGGLHVYNPPYAQEEIPDEKEVRLVIIGPEYPVVRNSENSPARKTCQSILERRGNAPRLFKNMLVFLAPDQTKLGDLEDAVRQFLAWQSIHKEADKLDLKSSEKQYVENKKSEMESIVKLRIAETWIWCIYPYQTPESINKIDWEEIKIQSQQEGLANKVCKKLKDEEHLLTTYGADRLKLDIERFNLWQGKNHIEVRQLWDFFATYPYLPRLQDQKCLFKAIESVYDGQQSLSIISDRFAYATGYDEVKEKYIGLIAEAGKSFSTSLSGLLVQTHVAQAQRTRELQKLAEPVAVPAATSGGSRSATISSPTSIRPTAIEEEPTTAPVASIPRRFFASVVLDDNRIGRDAGRIAEEVIQHLSDIPGAEVSVTMEIHVNIPDGISDQIVRTVTENCKTLKFKSHGFDQA